MRMTTTRKVDTGEGRPPLAVRYKRTLWNRTSTWGIRTRIEWNCPGCRCVQALAYNTKAAPVPRKTADALCSGCTRIAVAATLELARKPAPLVIAEDMSGTCALCQAVYRPKDVSTTLHAEPTSHASWCPWRLARELFP